MGDLLYTPVRMFDTTVQQSNAALGGLYGLHGVKASAESFQPTLQFACCGKIVVYKVIFSIRVCFFKVLL
jgi:hypothetical protein